MGKNIGGVKSGSIPPAKGGAGMKGMKGGSTKGGKGMGKKGC